MTFEFKSKIFQSLDREVNVLVYHSPLEGSWFEANGLAQALRYTKPYNTLVESVEPRNMREFRQLRGEDAGADKNAVFVPPNAMFVNTDGLYEFMIGSRKSPNNAVKQWFTKELIPSTRNYDLKQKQLETSNFVNNLTRGANLLFPPNRQDNNDLVSDD